MFQMGRNHQLVSWLRCFRQSLLFGALATGQPGSQAILHPKGSPGQCGFSTGKDVKQKMLLVKKLIKSQQKLDFLQEILNFMFLDVFNFGYDVILNPYPFLPV